MNTKHNADFPIRALELHSLYAWDYNWIIKTMDFMKDMGFNTLILHRNDFIDLIIYPGKYFGYEPEEQDTIFETRFFGSCTVTLPPGVPAPIRGGLFSHGCWNRRRAGK